MNVVNLKIQAGFRKFYICGECKVAYDDFAKKSTHQITYRVCVECGADDWKEKVGKLSDCGSKIELRAAKNVLK